MGSVEFLGQGERVLSHHAWGGALRLSTLESMACVDIPVPVSGELPAAPLSGWEDPDDGSDADLHVVATVTLGIDHTWAGDLTFKLLSPLGTTMTLMSRPGLPEEVDDGTQCCGRASNLVASSPITLIMDYGIDSVEDMGSMGAGFESEDNICELDGVCSFRPWYGAAAPGWFDLFVGEDMGGTWQFCAGDSGGGDTGTIESVILDIGDGCSS